MAAQVISFTGFRTEWYLRAILMDWGYSAVPDEGPIAQKYHSSAMRYKHPIMAQTEAQPFFLAEPQSGGGGPFRVEVFLMFTGPPRLLRW
jgi:hypothetical protein